MEKKDHAGTHAEGLSLINENHRKELGTGTQRKRGSTQYNMKFNRTKKFRKSGKILFLKSVFDLNIARAVFAMKTSLHIARSLA